MSDERRRAGRFKINQLVQMSFDREEFISAKGIDLSELGMLVESEDELDLGAKVFLLFEVPGPEGSQSIQSDGIVAHSVKTKGKYRTGIEFDGLFESDKAKIKRYQETLAE